LIDKDIDYARTPDPHVKQLVSALFVFTIAYLHAAFPLLFKKSQSKALNIGRVLFVILLPWVAIWGLSYTNIPLAYAFIGILIAFFRSAEKQIKNITLNEAHQKAFADYVKKISLLIQRFLQKPSQTELGFIDFSRQSITNIIKGRKAITNKKSHSKMSDFSASLVELGGIEPPSANPPQTDLHT